MQPQGMSLPHQAKLSPLYEPFPKAGRQHRVWLTGMTRVRTGLKALRRAETAVAAASGSSSSTSSKELLRVSPRFLWCMTERPVRELRDWLSKRCSVGSGPLLPDALASRSEPWTSLSLRLTCLADGVCHDAHNGCRLYCPQAPGKVFGHQHQHKCLVPSRCGCMAAQSTDQLADEACKAFVHEQAIPLQAGHTAGSLP